MLLHVITKRINLVLLVALLIAGCARAGGRPVATPTARMTLTPSSNDFSWLNYSFPTGWNETSPAHYEGSDGFAWLGLKDHQGAGAGAVCMSEANREKPARYGAYPEIRDLTLDGQPACLILPSPDQPVERKGEALYLLWVPESIQAGSGAGSLLALHADKEHILAIVESMQFTQPVAQQTASTCDFSISGDPPVTTQQEGLRIDAFPIAFGPGCSPYQEAASFSQRVETSPAAGRVEAVVASQWQPDRLNRLNAKLKPFGFLVEVYDDRLYRVLHSGKVARSNLSWVGQVSVRSDGQNFLFPVLDGYNATAYLVRPDGVHAMDDPDLLVYDQVFPVFSGADRISLAYDYQRYPRPPGSPALLEIRKNGALIETLSVSGANPAKGPARGLWSWQDAEGGNHWTLELSGLVIQDGESLNDRLGTAEILAWRLLKEKPFIMYRQGAQVQALYANRPLSLPFDEVIAEPQWGERILIQMRTYESGLVFYAKKGGVWYLVTITAE